MLFGGILKFLEWWMIVIGTEGDRDVEGCMCGT